MPFRAERLAKMKQTEQTLRIGLLGFGAMGRTHTWAVQNLPFFYGDLPYQAITHGVCTTSQEKSERVAKELDARGFCVRAGFHCAALAHRTMGTPPTGAIRLSPSLSNTAEHVDALAEAVAQIQNCGGS